MRISSDIESISLPPPLKMLANYTRLMMRAISFTHYQAFYPACQPQSAAASVMLAPAGRDSNLHSDQHLVLVFVNSKISLNPGQSYYRV